MMLQSFPESERNLQLNIHKVCQTASGGSHVTIYRAKVELVSSEEGIQVVGTAPEDAWPGDFQCALEAIRAGAQQVLAPKGLGASIHITSICLHPVDFKPRNFQLYTALELQALLEEK